MNDVANGLNSLSNLLETSKTNSKSFDVYDIVAKALKDMNFPPPTLVTLA